MSSLNLQIPGKMSLDVDFCLMNFTVCQHTKTASLMCCVYETKIINSVSVKREFMLFEIENVSDIY